MSQGLSLGRVRFAIISRLALIARTAFAVVLLLAAALKCRGFRASAAALETYGVAPTLRAPVTGAVIGAEAAIGVAVIAGAPGAAYAASALLALFALAAAAALLRGKRGAPCGCFGSRSRIGPSVVVRNLLLAGAFAAVPAVPSRTDWLVVAFAAAFLCIAALTVAVLALARELALLRLRLVPELALDVADEGPALGSDVELTPAAEASLMLAVFSSEGCRLCRALQPSVAALARDPSLSVVVFDEVRDADVWQRLRIPGSPYAVAVDRTGTVRAKGTFNSHGQLEAIVAGAAAG
jgi:hypothetical protein